VNHNSASGSETFFSPMFDILGFFGLFTHVQGA
jgi:hypothetical protein